MGLPVKRVCFHKSAAQNASSDPFGDFTLQISGPALFPTLACLCASGLLVRESIALSRSRVPECSSAEEEIVVISSIKSYGESVCLPVRIPNN